MLRLAYDPYLSCSKSLAFLLLFLCIPQFGGASQAGVQISIPANPLWTDTGIALSAGQTVTISASGQWTYHTFSTSGPDGDTNPNSFAGFADEFEFFDIADRARLLAFVGTDPYQGQWGNANFFPHTSGYISVGSGQTFKPTVSGELWLGINDDAVTKDVSDNSGALTATIAVVTSDTTGPAIHISVPTTVYPLNQRVLANYSCTDPDDPVVSCTGTVANGTPIDTSSKFAHAFTVVAEDSHGNFSSKRVTYFVDNAGLTPLGFAFKPQQIGTSSAPRTFRLINLQNVPLNIFGSPNTSGDFTVAGTTCTGTLAPHSSCSINVAFKPSMAGPRAGGLFEIDGVGRHTAQLVGYGK